MSRRLVIVGAGGHGRELCAAALAVSERDGSIEVIGFLAEGEQFPERAKGLGVSILGPPASLSEFEASYAIGIGDGAVRRRLDSELSASAPAATVVHPSALIGPCVNIGTGCYIAAQAVLTTAVELGAHTHVNVGVTVHHDAIIGNFCTIGPGSLIAGWVKIGDGVTVGIGATISDRVTIGDNAFIGAGAVVVHDVPPNVTVVGVPARPLQRSNS